MGYVSGVPLLGAVAISAKKMYPGPDDRTEYKKRYIHLGSYTYPSVREYISRFLRLSSPSPARVSSLDLAVLVLLCSGAGALFHFLPPSLPPSMAPSPLAFPPQLTNPFDPIAGVRSVTRRSETRRCRRCQWSTRLQKTELAHTICVTSQTVYASAYTYEDMEALLSDLQSKMEKEPFKMLIINSVTTLFNTELCNGCAFDGCQIKTLEMMYCLRMIANKFHIGVYVTNHEEMGLTDAKIKRSLKQGLYFMEVKDLRKLNNAVQVTTGNSSLGDMHQGGDMHEDVFLGLQDFRTKIRVSYPNSWFYLDASSDDKIKQLSQMIEKRISLSRESFYLTYLGRKLEPESTLRELGLVVSLITFELHVRLRGGCPDKGNQSLREFIASNSVCWITMSHGKNLYSNRLVREVLVRYPGQKGMRQVVKLVMQPLAILSQHAVKDLDETSVCEDYKKISKLFLDMLELNKGHPLYLSHLCSKMKSANVTSAKSNTFQLFLRVHPSLMTYSTRSSLLWEMKREIDGLLPPNAKNIQSAIDQILMNRDWTLIAKQEAAFSPTYNRSYKKSSSECFKFIRNWLTHGIENFNTSDPRRFTTEDMDYLLEIVFKDFLADIVWTLLQNNIGNLNRWSSIDGENHTLNARCGFETNGSRVALPQGRLRRR
uniref:Ubiquitin-like domain-containing protein n=1 Tax=Oryza glumipatula TaxID=40148 RepID=A0A0E0BPT0_9ORYZ